MSREGHGRVAVVTMVTEWVAIPGPARPGGHSLATGKRATEARGVGAGAAVDGEQQLIRCLRFTNAVDERRDGVVAPNAAGTLGDLLTLW